MNRYKVTLRENTVDYYVDRVEYEQAYTAADAFFQVELRMRREGVFAILRIEPDPDEESALNRLRDAADRLRADISYIPLD